MIYIYTWFEETGWSFDPPTAADLASVDTGELEILEIQGTDLPPKFAGSGETVPECDVDFAPDGDMFHIVRKST